MACGKFPMKKLEEGRKRQITTEPPYSSHDYELFK
jgi:hypothetical protein